MRNTLILSLILSALTAETLKAAEPVPGRQVEMKLDVPGKGTIPYLIYLPRDFKADGPKRSLMLFLHGRGESYGPLSLVKKWGPPRKIDRGEHFPHIVISPQCPREDEWKSERQQALLVALLDHMANTWPIDRARVYLTGLSMGGYGSWRLAADHADRFAAVIPICGGGQPADAAKLKDLPIWVFHGMADTVVLPERSTEMVDAIKKAGGTKIKYTTYEEIGHNSWSATYAMDEVFSWMQQQKRGD